MIDWSNEDNWRPSSFIGGTPGSADSNAVPARGAIVINEVLAHSDDDDPDWIELFNASDGAVDVSGWFLSDRETNLQKYMFPANSFIESGGFLVVFEDRHFNNANAAGTISPFALSENGETVYLSSGRNGMLSGYREKESFGASETGVSLGRYVTNDEDVNFAPLMAMTPGEANADPIVNAIIITEIMYDPGSNDTREEYIEIFNNSAAPVALFGEASLPWKFTSGIDYTFPAWTTLPAFARMIIAKDVGAFMAAYTVAPGTTVLGPYGGQLNDGEAIEISLPGDVDNDNVRYYIRQERVRYDSKSPWPVGADGDGSALTRLDPAAYGNDATNWTASAPTPGS